MRSLSLLLLAAMFAGCIIVDPIPPMPKLATHHVARDFDTYEIRRVGLMPFGGDSVELSEATSVQMSFLAELSGSTPYELVLLDHQDLDEVQGSDPYRRGWYSPRTIIELSERYSLDAVMFGTIVQHQYYPPQMLSVQMDMVAAETGLVVWSSSVHLDASNEEVRSGLQAFYRSPNPRGVSSGWEVALVSPRRFARFAAHQISMGL